MWPSPVSLTGAHASLVPLDPSHAGDLRAASADGALHQLWYTTVPAPDEVEAEIARRLALQEAGTMLPFAVLDAGGAAVGMTTYMNIDAANRRVEIGSTWYRKAVQRTGLNTQIKLLMLTHAFEALDCISVEFRTHVLNTQSRRAIERLGAKLDGILRALSELPEDVTLLVAGDGDMEEPWRALAAELGASAVVPGLEVVRSLRARKDAHELELMDHANLLTKRAIAAVAERLDEALAEHRHELVARCRSRVGSDLGHQNLRSVLERVREDRHQAGVEVADEDVDARIE